MMGQFGLLSKIRSRKKLDHTIDGKLAKATRSLDQNVIKSWEDIIPTLAKSSYEGTVIHQIDTLNELISHYYEYKRYCYLRKNYRIYFQSTWEHCHSSKNPDFEYIEPYVERYNYLLANKEQLLNKEQFHEKCMDELEEKLFHIISHNSGILQKNIYSYFNPCIRNDISTLLYCLSKEGKIIRSKSGNSYKLYLPE